MTGDLVEILDIYEINWDRLMVAELLINIWDSAASESFGSSVCLFSGITAVAVELPELID